MNAKRLRMMFGPGLSGALTTSLGFVWLLALAAPVARAEVRESIKRGLPATVCVEWHGSAAKPAGPNPVVPTRSALSGKPGKDMPGWLAGTPRATSDILGMASGTIVSADGLIVTMMGAQESGQYSVKLGGDGKTLPARLLVDDRRTGLQLLKVDAADLPFLVPASRPAQIGEEVTWTYSLGLQDRGAGRGIITTTGRDLPGLGTDLLQIDGAPAVGSAGAPLVDEEGRLLGIIAFSRVGESQRRGFAIPVSAVQALLEARRGEEPVIVQRGMLGIAMSRSGVEGPAVIARPTADSPAAAAGIHDGDVVVAIDGKKIETPEDIVRLVSAHAAGETVKVTIRRDGKEQEFNVPLVAQLPAANPPATIPLAPAAPGSSGSAGSAGSENYAPVTQPPTTAPPQKPLRVTAVRPDSIYVLDAEGKVHALPIEPGDKSLERLRQFYDSVSKARPDAPATVPSVQIQRSDMEKKLEEIGRDVLTLRQQMEKLTEEMQRLHKQLSGATPKP